MNNATVVKILMYQRLQNLGVKNHGQQSDVLMLRMQQIIWSVQKNVLCC